MHAWERRFVQCCLAAGAAQPDIGLNFRSLYFREPNDMLFEIARDGPGFAVDKSFETMGEALSLPPFIEPTRAQIEGGLKPLG